MSELIINAESSQIDELKSYIQCLESYIQFLENYNQVLEKELDANSKEQKHGHWIYHGNDFFECSVCKHYDKTIKANGNNFCKWCGAKMDGGME